MNAQTKPPGGAVDARREHTHAADLPIEVRCVNWARCYVDRLGRRGLLSVEGRYRNRWAIHWDADAIVGTAPDVRPFLDYIDASAINSAWQAIPDAYHQTILGAHYVRLWSPNKCHSEASRVAGSGGERDRVTERQFARILEMAHALLEVQLAIPAVVRRTRLTARVRLALELEIW